MNSLSYNEDNIISKFILLFYERIISENKTSESFETLCFWWRKLEYKEILISKFHSFFFFWMAFVEHSNPNNLKEDLYFNNLSIYSLLHIFYHSYGIHSSSFGTCSSGMCILEYLLSFLQKIILQCCSKKHTHTR